MTVETPLAPIGPAAIGASYALEELFKLTHKLLGAFWFVISRPLPKALTFGWMIKKKKPVDRQVHTLQVPPHAARCVRGQSLPALAKMKSTPSGAGKLVPTQLASPPPVCTQAYSSSAYAPLPALAGCEVGADRMVHMRVQIVD